MFVILRFHLSQKAFLGRPQVWGIAVGGQAGASKILNIVRDELDMTMALSGETITYFYDFIF